MAKQLSMINLYTSSQKMLFNIMTTNIMLCKTLGVSKELLQQELFEIDPAKDLGIYDTTNKNVMNPKKC